MDTHGTLEGWLQSLSLEQYISTFQNAGFTCLEHCITLDDELLNIIGIAPLGHRKRILTNLPTLTENEYSIPKSQLLEIVDRNTESTEIKNTSPSVSSDLDSNHKNGDSSERPRPVPKPRKTKRNTKVSENDTTDSSPRPVPAPRSGCQSKLGSFLLKGVTIGESTDDTDNDTQVASSQSGEDNSQLKFVSDTKNSLKEKMQNEVESMYINSSSSSQKGSQENVLNLSKVVPPPVSQKNSEGTTLTNPSYFGEEQTSDEGLYESIWVTSRDKSQNSDIQTNHKQTTTSPVKQTDIDNIAETAQMPPVLPAKKKTSSSENKASKETDIDTIVSDSHMNKISQPQPSIPSKKASTNENSSFNQTNIDQFESSNNNSFFNENTNPLTDNQLYANESVKSRQDKRSQITSNLMQFSPDMGADLFTFDRDSKTDNIDLSQRQIDDIKLPQRLGKSDTICESEDSLDFPKNQTVRDSSESDESNYANTARESISDFSKGSFEISDDDFVAMLRKPATSNTIEQTSLDNLSTNTIDVRKSFDMPPPVFPPPPLPTKPISDVISSFDDLTCNDPIAAFDPLKIEPAPPALPPVPPRGASVSSAADTSYVNLETSKSNVSPPDSEKKKQSVLYSLAGSTAKEGFKFSDTSFSTSCDPFHGDDPFSEFATECEQFNQGGVMATEAAFEDDSPGYQDFDPFGLNREDSGKRSNEEVVYTLNDVPPPPHWNESIHDPGSLYAMAKGMQLDGASTDESSDLDSEDPLDSSPEPMPIGSDIVTSVLSPRNRERSGYLYKQGGMKGNKGWRKRWVIFNGNDLRYYANAKIIDGECFIQKKQNNNKTVLLMESQVSKRIVPLSCMKRVDVNVKGTDTSRFKFHLVTNNRIFIFAAETLDDCTMWSSTLMEAILKYTPPPDGEHEGGDMYDPDRQGYVKFERKKDKYYVAIKQGKLCYYNTEQDYKQASPIHEIEMKLASVKDVGKNKLQMSTHYAYFILVFDSYHDCLLWKMAIEEAIADGLGDNRVLNEVQKNPSNLVCADCDTKDPHWASINLGIVLCKKCAGIHRHFDVRLSRVKSLRMDTAIWTPSLIEMMKAIGNDNAKKFWEGSLRERILEKTAPAQRKQFLENKYKQKAFCNSHPLTGNQRELDEALLRAAETDDLFLTMQLVFSGANVLYSKSVGSEEETEIYETAKSLYLERTEDLVQANTAFQIAKRAGQRLQMEFLYQNGGDKYSRGYADSEEALALRLRSEVCLEGYLMKTGSNMKDFLKRWCVLEHGCIRYFTTERSSIAKDSIEHECIQCIHATPLDRSMFSVRTAMQNHKMELPVARRYPHAFELSTIKKGNRCYLFAASSAEEKQTWFRAIAKLFCPVPLFEEVGQLDFCLAGNFFIREGLTSEWRKTWLMINEKVVYYTDKDIKLTEQIDLRKVTNIKYQDAVSSCTYSTEGGRCFVVDIPGKALYFQANLERDTVKLFTELEKRMKSGGDLLVDQQLTSEDIPVIVDKCIKFIEDNGLKERGVYREAAVNSKVQGILNKLTSDAYSLVLQRDIHTVHEVANVLKRFFRNLKEPLLTSNLYDQWIQHSGNSDHDTKLKWFKYLVGQIPTVHYLTLKRLAVHLARLSKYSDENMMTIENIATSFGSTLMKASCENQLQGQHGKIPLEMKVIGDIVTYHEWLFEIENRDKEIEKQIAEAKRKIEFLQSNSVRQSIQNQGTLIISIHYLDYRGQSENQQVNNTTEVRSAIDLIKRRLNIKTGTWSLHEVVCKGSIERPLHPNDNIYNVVMAWAGWEEPYRSSVCLCLKPDDLLQKVDNAYEFGRPLFADLKFSEKKNFKKFTFEFKQSRLSYSKDMKSAGTPINSWNIEDLNVYVGADPKRTCPTKYSFSFVAKGEKIGKDTPYFGRTVCCNSEDELMSWVAAMMVAQHPEGLLS